jgi:hypothetical protein
MKRPNSAPLPTYIPPVPYEVVQTFKPIAEWFKYMPQAEVDRLPVEVINAFDTLCQYTHTKLPRESK